MTSITVEQGGTLWLITDIAPYVIERDDIILHLDQIYAGYEQLPEGSLDPQEEIIVELVNRYHQLDDWIARFESQATRRANIEAGWSLLKRIKGEG